MHKERENYLQFIEECYNKFLKGDKKYKGKWKEYTINREIKELKEELYDICIYSYFINEKIRKIENILTTVQNENKKIKI